MARMSEDIHYRSVAALEGAGIHAGPMLLDGLDVTLIGSKSSPQVSEAAIWAVQKVWGVRSVQVRIHESATTARVGEQESPFRSVASAAFPAPEVRFETASSQLARASLPGLDAAAAWLTAHPEQRLSIEGHTDAEGDPAANVVLSLLRGESVRSYLISKGAARSRISVAGWGSSRPVASNDTAVGRHRNRRIEFHFKESY